ncbi:hypothetical protein H0H93_007093 [Arthromyces matolae]|nr:hypothetical protein H0H93_007093 [Arthromyces matolae]
MFSKLALKVTPNVTPSELCRRLYHLLSSSPSICSYIRELDVLEGSQLGTQVAPHVVLTGGQPVVSWVSNDRSLPHIFRKLTHLKRLDFGAQSATIQWSKMQSPARSAIRQMLSLSTLTYLRLAFWNFISFRDLSALLSCCKSLQGLTLSNITFGYPADAPGTPPVLSDLQEEEVLASERHQCRLHFLTVEHVSSPEFGNWLLGPESSLDLTSLRELRLTLFNDIDFVKSSPIRPKRELQSSFDKTHSRGPFRRSILGYGIPRKHLIDQFLRKRLSRILHSPQRHDRRLGGTRRLILEGGVSRVEEGGNRPIRTLDKPRVYSGDTVTRRSGFKGRREVLQTWLEESEVEPTAYTADQSL